MTKPLHAASKLPLLLLLLLSPSMGLAAPQDAPVAEEEATTSEAQEESEGAQEDSQLTEPELEPEWKPDPRVRAPQGLRVLSETGFGALTTVGGGFAGTLVGLAVCPLFGHQNQKFGCLGDMLLGGAAGLVLGLPLGIWWGGNIAGGDGGLGYTYLGALVGTVGTVLVLGTASQLPFVAALGFVLPVVGGILGYELSMSPEAPSVALGGTRLQPLLSASSRGGFVGLGGTF
jgi:hypothetical protein